MGIGDGFTRRLLADAGIAPGMRVLDIGCGPGDVALMMADLVGAQGHVTGLDQSAPMLAQARQRADAAGIGHFAVVQGDLSDPLSLAGLAGPFDAIVGRRVLMYLPDAQAILVALAALLKPGGLMLFHEHDASAAPIGIEALPLHARVHGWTRAMLVAEGCDLHIGFHLHGLLRAAGLDDLELRAEAIVQTPDQPHPLGWLVEMVQHRIIAAGAASAAQIDIGTLQARLDAERLASGATYVADMMFGIHGRKPAA